ncbi:hypothetical protein M8494_22160 [Serratia ureilytica]
MRRGTITREYHLFPAVRAPYCAALALDHTASLRERSFFQHQSPESRAAEIARFSSVQLEFNAASLYNLAQPFFP